MPYRYMSPKPNRRTVRLMFALGIMIGCGFAYVAIDPDNIIDTFANRVCTNYMMPQTPASDSAERVMMDVEQLLDEPVMTEEEEESTDEAE